MQEYSEKGKVAIKIIIVFVVVLVLSLSVHIYKANNLGSPVDVSSELMPIKGPVIADIQGEEYHYNQIYLYRLLDIPFVRNYNKTLMSTPSLSTEETQSIYDLILLELYYREAISEDSGITVSNEEIRSEQVRRINYTGILHYKAADRLDKPLQKKSLFYEGQTESEYSEDLIPYIKKYLYIMKYMDMQQEILIREIYNGGTYGFENLREGLLEKYGVTLHRTVGIFEGLYIPF